MSRARAWSIAPVVVIAVMVSEPTPAQDVSEGLRACARQAEDVARLKCYDSEMQRLAAAVQASPAPVHSGSSMAGSTMAVPPPTPAAPVPSVEMSPEQAFGYRGSIARDEVDKRKEQRATLERLEAVVAKVERKPLGEFVLTFENGQVWTQKEPDLRARVKVGDTVTIRRASLGSFLMVVPGGRSTQVARVR